MGRFHQRVGRLRPSPLIPGPSPTRGEGRTLLSSAFRRAILATSLLLTPLPAQGGVIGRDDRVPLTRLATGDAAERALATAARASGLITCDNGRFGSASLVGRADVVVTAAHLFFGEAAKVRSGAVRCLYIADGLPTGPRHQVVGSSLVLGAERVTGVNICSNGRDWAVLRLATPVAGVVPYVLPSGVPNQGAPAAIVSHGGGTGALRGPGGHAGTCRVRDHVGPCRQTGLPLVFTDCDAETGSSGGATLIQENGRWVIGGVTRGASPTGGGTYDRARVYHMAVPIAGAFLNAIRAMRR